jgi:RND family efflux transporter MFP subunit
MRPASWLTAVVLLALGVTACKQLETVAEREPAAAPVKCAAAAERSIGDAVILRGLVAPPPRADAVMSSTIAGRLTEVRVEVGDVVAAHEVVARVDDPSLAANSEEGKAAIASARAALASAETARVRLEKLVAEGISSQVELDAAVAQEAAAKAQLAAAKARAGGASGQLARADLRAPRAGTVLRIFRRAGEAVDGTPATPVLEIADVSVLELRCDAPAADLVRLASGTPATVAFDALPGMTVAGKIVAVAPAVDPASALGEVRVALEPKSDGSHLVVGLSGAATVALAPRHAVVVPIGALRRGLSGADEVVKCEGVPPRAAVAEVTVGMRLSDVAEITKGLTAGERIVVDRALGIEDGRALDDGESAP